MADPSGRLLLEMFIKPKSKQASNRSFFFQALSPISRPAFVPSRDHRLAQGLHHWALRLRHELHRHFHDVSFDQEPIRYQAISIL